MMYKIGIIPLFLVTISTISNAQRVNWAQKHNLRFVDSSEVARVKHVSDSLLIVRLGKKNFKNWLNSVSIYEMTKFTWKTSGGGQACPTCPIGLPYSFEVEELASFNLEYLFTIPGLGDFKLTQVEVPEYVNQRSEEIEVAPIGAQDIHDILPSWTKDPESWSLIDTTTLQSILSKNDAINMTRRVMFIDKRVFLSLTDPKRSWLMRMTDGKLFKKNEMLVALKDSADQILRKQIGDKRFDLWVDSVISEVLTVNYYKGKTGLTYLYRYYLHIPNTSDIYCSIGYDLWGNLNGGYNFDKFPNCAQDSALCSFITKNEALEIAALALKHDVMDKNCYFTLQDKKFIWIAWVREGNNTMRITFDARTGADVMLENTTEEK